MTYLKNIQIQTISNLITAIKDTFLEFNFDYENLKKCLKPF